MIALIDSTKTTGLIFFPGTMVEILLAGADPTDAVRLQLILLYTLLGSVALSGLIAITLAYRNFFTLRTSFASSPSRSGLPESPPAASIVRARDGGAAHLQRHPAHRSQAPRQPHRGDPPVRRGAGPRRRRSTASSTCTRSPCRRTPPSFASAFTTRRRS